MKAFVQPPITERHFSIFRVLFGAYLFWHFAHLVPYAAEIFSRDGVLSEASLNMTYGLFPNLLWYFSGAAATQIFTVALSVLSLAYIFGFHRRLVSLLLWYGWACLFNSNNLISNPGLPYVGWILLATALVPSGEAGSLDSRHKSGRSWRFPKELFWGAWILLAVGYTLSGWAKLNSPSWRDGTALTHLLNNPLSRDNALREFMLAVPEPLMKLKTWSVLGLELVFAPLSLIACLRPWLWGLMIVLHLGILSVVAFADLTLGMLMIHAFTLDPRWRLFWPQKASSGTAPQPVLFFDGVCGLCNHFIDFLFAEDHRKEFLVSPLQSELASRTIPSDLMPQNLVSEDEFRSVILYADGRVYSRSSAVLKVMQRLGGFWSLSLIFWLIPTGLRDSAYDFVARNRYKWFGRKESCRMPTSDERSRFLM